MKILDNIIFWIKNSRPYTIPITSLCFLVIFVYSLVHNGNIAAGLIAYIGVSLVHLATNLSDDYFDYLKLIKNNEFCAKECKCSYLREGKATIKDLRNAIITMLTIAGGCGAILFFISGYYVILGLGDIAVILTYGPLMYCGVYYVMTKSFSAEVIILSLACSIIVETILYAHMLMDFNDDINAGKTTVCTMLKTVQNALNGLVLLYTTSFIIICVLCVISGNYAYLLTFLTIPLIIKLYISLKAYNEDNRSMPKIEIWNYPLNTKKQLPVNAPFFHRFFLSINISTLFMLLTCIGIVL